MLISLHDLLQVTKGLVPYKYSITLLYIILSFFKSKNLYVFSSVHHKKLLYEISIARALANEFQ